MTCAHAIAPAGAEVCVEDGVTPEDLIARLDSALLNSGETSVTSGLVASLRGELVSSCMPFGGSSLVQILDPRFSDFVLC